MGLGASAHSFDGRQRSWNVADIETYIAAIGRGERPCTVEALDPDTHYEDVVLTSLRTAEGIDLAATSEASASTSSWLLPTRTCARAISSAKTTTCASPAGASISAMASQRVYLYDCFVSLNDRFTDL